MSSKRRNKTKTRSVELTKDEQRALEMRVACKTLKEIGDALGMTVQGARQVILRALKRSDEAMAKQGEKHRELEAQRLGSMMAKLWDVAVGDVRVVPKKGADGIVRKTIEEASLEAQNKAVDRILKIMERRAKMLGLDMPTRSEITGASGEPIKTVTVAEVVHLPPLREPADATSPLSVGSHSEAVRIP